MSRRLVHTSSRNDLLRRRARPNGPGMQLQVLKPATWALSAHLLSFTHHANTVWVFIVQWFLGSSWDMMWHFDSALHRTTFGFRLDIPILEHLNEWLKGLKCNNGCNETIRAIMPKKLKIRCIQGVLRYGTVYS